MKFTIRRLWAAVMAVLMALSLTACTVSFAPEEEETAPPRTLGDIGYATEGVTIVEDANQLAKQVAEAYEAAQQEGIGVEYKNEAYSRDGLDYDCYIGNPASSPYDVFITIYYDDTFQEELFLSQLIRPGQAFNHITLNRALTEADHRVCCAYTQVHEVDGELAIRGQTVITLDFHII